MRQVLFVVSSAPAWENFPFAMAVGRFKILLFSFVRPMSVGLELAVPVVLTNP